MKRAKGRLAVKGEKIQWDKVVVGKLSLVHTDAEKHIRTAPVWVKSLGRIVRLVAVEYLREDGRLQSRKLHFCTDREKNWQCILNRYGIWFQIEFLFRDAKQFLGITSCQPNQN